MQKEKINIINSEAYQGGGLKNRNMFTQTMIQILFDFFAISGAYLLQYYVRFVSGWVPVSLIPDFTASAVTGIVMLVYWFLLFFFSGMYKNWHIRSPFEEIFSIVKIIFFGCAAIVFLTYTDSSSSPRMLFLTYFAFFTSLTIIGRTIARRIQISLRRKRIITIPSIIIGSGKRAVEFYKKTEKASSWGYKVFGIIFLDSEDEKYYIENVDEYNLKDLHFIAESSSLGYILDEFKPSEVIISIETPNHKGLLDIAAQCSERGIKVNIEPDLYDIFTGQTRAQNIYGIPLIEIRTQLMKPWQLVIKRLFDIMFSMAVILIGLPIWLLIALIVKLDSPGKVFYTQPRVGKNGKVFKMFKFRSMRPVKDAVQQWTTVNDPRVTKFGRFIRKTHLDEIPQFYNVLIGDMSVVGPRPEQPKFVEDFTLQMPHYKRRHCVRPGITGWWQVKYESYVLNMDEIEGRLKDDFYYIENMSIQLDVEIVFRTVWCVVIGHGQA